MGTKRPRALAVCCVFLPLSWFASAVLLQAGPIEPKDELQLALEIWTNEVQSIRSMRAHYTWTQRTFESGHGSLPSPEVLTRDILLLQCGQEYREETKLTLKDTQWAETRAYNGREYRTFVPSRNEGSIAWSPRLPNSLTGLAYRVNDGNLLSFLKDNYEKLNASRGTTDHGEARLIVNLTTGGTDYEFSLDPEAHYHPRSIVCRSIWPEGEQRLTGLMGRQLKSEVLKFAEVNDCFFPTEVRTTCDKLTLDGAAIRDMDHSLLVGDIQANVDVNDSAFTIDFPKGTEVTLYDLATVVTIGGIYMQTIPPEGGPAVGPPEFLGTDNVAVPFAVPEDVPVLFAVPEATEATEPVTPTENVQVAHGSPAGQRWPATWVAAVSLGVCLAIVVISVRLLRHRRRGGPHV